MSNSSLNGTSIGPVSCLIDNPSTETQVGKTLAYLLIMVLALVGNLFVVLIVYKNKSMQTTVNYLIVNMAVSDMLQSFIAIPKRVMEIYAGSHRWLIHGVAGEFSCKSVAFLQDIGTAVSIQSLVVIAIDRFLGVMFPMRKASLMSARAHFVIITITWLIPMAFHSPYFFTFRLVDQSNKTYCIYSWDVISDGATHQLNYFLGGSIALFFLPLVMLIILYSVIIISLSRRKIPGNNSFRNRRRAAQRSRSVLRMVITVVVVFAICWLPLNVFGYLMMVKWGGVEEPPPCFLEDFGFWALFLAYSNAAINPFLYFLFSENYRKGFQAVFSGRSLTFYYSVNSKRRNLVDGAETSGSDTRDGMSLKSIKSLSRSGGQSQNHCLRHVLPQKK